MTSLLKLDFFYLGECWGIGFDANSFLQDNAYRRKPVKLHEARSPDPSRHMRVSEGGGGGVLRVSSTWNKMTTWEGGGGGGDTNRQTHTKDNSDKESASSSRTRHFVPVHLRQGGPTEYAEKITKHACKRTESFHLHLLFLSASKKSPCLRICRHCPPSPHCLLRGSGGRVLGYTTYAADPYGL